MDLIATVNVLCKVKNVKEGKDKVSGAPNGVLYVSAAHEGGMIDFQLEKQKWNGIKFGDILQIVFDASPKMIKEEFGQSVSWRHGYIVGEIMEIKKVNRN